MESESIMNVRSHIAVVPIRTDVVHERIVPLYKGKGDNTDKYECSN